MNKHLSTHTHLLPSPSHAIAGLEGQHRRGAADPTKTHYREFPSPVHLYINVSMGRNLIVVIIIYRLKLTK